MNQTILSIIVPVFNGGEYLNECLDSLVKQKDFDTFELILVNDGSPDIEDHKLLKKYSDKYNNVNLINLEANLGTSLARKKGIEYASGEYIGFLDTDDYAFPNTFTTLCKTAKNTNSDIVIGNYAVFSDLEEGIKKHSKHNIGIENLNPIIMSGEHLYYRQMRRITFPYYLRIDWWNKIYRKTLLNKSNVNFIQAVRNEGTLSLQASVAAKTVAVVPSVLFLNRKNIGSVSRTVSHKNIKDCIATTNVHKLMLQNRKMFKGNYKKFFIDIFFYICVDLNLRIAQDSADQCVIEIGNAIIDNLKTNPELFKLFLEYIGERKSRSELLIFLNCLKSKNKSNIKLILSQYLNKPALKDQLLYKKNFNSYCLDQKISITNNKPIISIVTITKDIINQNRTENIMQLVDSIVSQSYPSSCIEHIFIDAYSRDGTFDFLTKLQSQTYKPSLIVSEKDGGVYEAMNKGLSLVNGSYFTFINSDDYLHKYGLENLITPMIKNSNIAYTYGDAWKVDENSNLVGSHKANEHKAWFGSPYCHQSLLCKTNPMRNFAFDTSYKITMMKYALDLFLSDHRGAYIEKKTSYFRVGGLSTNERTISKMQAEQLRVKENIANAFKMNINHYLKIEDLVRNHASNLTKETKKNVINELINGKTRINNSDLQIQYEKFITSVAKLLDFNDKGI